MLVSQNSDRLDFTTVLKLFIDFLFVGRKMHIAHEDAAAVAIIFCVEWRIRRCEGVVLRQSESLIVGTIEIIFLLKLSK